MASSSQEQHIRGPLALVGGGEMSSGCEFDSELVEMSVESRSIKASNAQVLIVPTAAAYENPDKKVQQGIDYFKSLKVKTDVLEIYTRSDALEVDASELKKKLDSSSVIYLIGGSPMHLRSVLTETPLLDEIKAAWQAGAVLVGAGAGGDVFCDYMVDARGGAFTVGLNLISEISVIPGYDLWSEDKVHRTVQLAPPDIFVAGVPLQTALISKAGESWWEAGSGKVDIFRDGKKIAISDLPLL